MADLLLLEPVGGAAGDMFLAAALDLGVERRALEAALATLGVPFRLEVRRAEANGIAGTHVDVVAEGPQPPARGLLEIEELVRRSGLAPRAREAALALFDRIGRAEAKIHGIGRDEVHFHEVGAVDSIVDVCGAAVVMDLLGWPRALSLPPELGRGMVKTAHGPLPVPSPATLEILAGKSVRYGGPPGEAVTPTGAAILAVLCEIGAPPPFAPRRVGYGVGTSRWPDRPNVLRMTLGETGGIALPSELGRGVASADLSWRAGVWQLEANLDDCPGQLVARAVEAALEAGALDAWAAPITMKKGRPGVVLAALAAEDRRDAVARVLVAETTTLGVRAREVERLELEREQVAVQTEYGEVRVKVGRLPGAAQVLTAHPEYDDCLACARERGVAVKEVMAAAAAAYRRKR
jgi:uncharacterized protein (TIGR00299 family) protein